MVLRPQGVGAALYLASEGALPSDPGYGAIVDVGTRTTDVLTVDLPTLTPVPELCFSLEAGVATAAEALPAAVQAKTGRLPPPDVAVAALTAPVAWGAGTVGGSAAKVHLDDLAATVRTEVRRRFGGDADRVLVHALVGGGSVLLGDRLAHLLPGRTVEIGAEDAVFANALGFADAAAHAARKYGAAPALPAGER